MGDECGVCCKCDVCSVCGVCGVSGECDSVVCLCQWGVVSVVGVIVCVLDAVCVIVW